MLLNEEAKSENKDQKIKLNYICFKAKQTDIFMFGGSGISSRFYW